LDTGNIIWIGVIAASAIAAIPLFMHLRNNRRRLKAAEKGMAAGQAVLKSNELKLTLCLEKKKHRVHEARVELGQRNAVIVEKKLGDIKEIIEEQSDILKKLTHIDKKDLSHLKHIGIDFTDEKGDKLHVSQMIGHFEAVFGKLDSQDAREAQLQDIHADTDPIRQCVKYLAFTMVYLNLQFNSLNIMMQEQAKLIIKAMVGLHKLKTGSMRPGEEFAHVLQKTADDLTRLESSMEKESSEIDLVIKHSGRLNTYLQQLEQSEAAKHLMEGPFFIVEGHSVDVVIDEKSRKAKAAGRGEKISLRRLPDGFIVGTDKDKCSVVLGGEVSPHHAFFTRHDSAVVMKPNSGTAGNFIVRHSKGLLMVCHDDADRDRLRKLLDSSFNKNYDSRYDYMKQFRTKEQKVVKDAYVTKHIKLVNGDRLLFPFGYELRFVEK
jgi:hypothetical protein